MAIQYAGGTNVNAAANVLTRNALIVHIRDQFVLAGWSSTSVKSRCRLTLSGIPLNTETVSIDGKTYTFKTVINNATDGEVFIGATAAAALANLRDAINLGAGGGTDYASAMTLHSTCEANTTTITATTLDIEDKTAAVYTSRSTTETLTSGAFSNSTMGGAGYKLTSATTAAGLNMCLWLHDFGTVSFGSPQIYVRISNSDDTKSSHTYSGAAGNWVCNIGAVGSSWRVIANKYQGFCLIDSAGTSATGFFGCGVLHIETFLHGKAVTAATNASPIVITSASHGYLNADNVYICQALGNTAANGIYVVANKTDNTFELQGTTGNGAWTSGGLIAKINGQISEAIWGEGSAFATHFIRTCLSTVNTNSDGWTTLNGSTGAHNSTAVGQLQIIMPRCATDTNAQAIQWYNNGYLIGEAVLGWETPTSSPPRCIGDLYDAVVFLKSETGLTVGSYDSHNWLNLTHNNSGAADNQAGSLFIVTP